MSRLIDADAIIQAVCTKLGIKDKKFLLQSEKAIVDVILNAPTIEVPKWIPCEERLPEEGEYLVTWGDIGDGVVDIAYYGKPTNPTREVNGLCFYDYNDEYGDIPYSTVIAWMPLPKPYGERKDNGKDL